jgi:uncharacterized membrane protein YbhN (UPF0104 family)
VREAGREFVAALCWAALSSRNTKRAVRLLIGIALSGVALWLALRRTSLSEVGDAFGRVSWGWIPLMVLAKATVLVIKDLRWRVELRAMAPGPYRRTFRAIGLGYFGNLVLPFKLGELLRVGLLKRHNPDVGMGDALATIGAERTIDGIVLAALVGVTLPYTDVPEWVWRGTVLLMVVMLGVAAVAMLEPLHRFAMRLFPETGPLSFGRKIVRAVSTGTRVLRRPKPLVITVVLTAAAWLGDSLALYFALQAFGLQLGYSVALIVLLLLSVGLLIPAAPGQLGTHQALMVLFLGPFGVPSGLAVTVSIVMQGVTLATLGSIGGYVLVREAGTGELIRGELADG